MAVVATVAVLCLVIFVGDSVAVETRITMSVDRNLELGIHQDLSSSLRPLMLRVTTLGSTGDVITLAIAAAILFLLGRALWASVFVAVSPAGATALESMMKHLFHRARPHLWPNAMVVHGYSFPSGHATASMAFFAALTYAVWRLGGSLAGAIAGILAAIIVLAVGFSRIYLGVHWPTDVLGGYSLALFWVCLLILTLEAVTRWMRAHRHSTQPEAEPSKRTFR